MARRFRDLIFATILVFFFTDGTLSNDLVKEIDMFKAVGLLDKQFTGVTKIQGKHSQSAAFRFTSSTSHLKASTKAYEDANKLIHNSHDFWVSAYAKLGQNAYSENPIVSINSKDGSDVFFRLLIKGNSRGTGMAITIQVQLKGGSLKTVTADTDRYLKFTEWHKVAVRIQDSESLIRIYVDDKMLKVVSFGRLDSYPSDAELRLAQVFTKYMEGTPTITRRFVGDLQDVKFTLGKRGNCPPLGTCKCSDVVGKKNCVMDGLRYEDGHRWKKNNCTICQCKWGQVICTYTCEVCTDDGQTYLHGEIWKQSNDSCWTCRCEKGKSICSPPFCPTPDCSGKSGDVIIPPGKCCKVCKEDQCLGTGKVYEQKGCVKTCDNYQDYVKQGLKCKSGTEGCFCPNGKVLKDGQCVGTASCPCTYKGKRYEPGESFQDPCQFCICSSGIMNCHKWC